MTEQKGQKPVLTSLFIRHWSLSNRHYLFITTTVRINFQQRIWEAHVDSSMGCWLFFFFFLLDKLGVAFGLRKEWDFCHDQSLHNSPLADQLGLHFFLSSAKIWFKFWRWERNSANNVGTVEPVGWIWFKGRCESYHGHKPNRNFGSSTDQTRLNLFLFHYGELICLCMFVL
jgi:hypothetical protein